MTIAVGRVAKEENDLFDIMDDWLRMNRFIFIGWFGLLLFSYAYFRFDPDKNGIPRKWTE
jgi:hypothetical protein